ncbi:hypothetical protein BST61_g6729 [Cercospora zeina]
MKTGSLVYFFALCATLVFALPFGVVRNIEVDHNSEYRKATYRLLCMQTRHHRKAVKLRVKKNTDAFDEAVRDFAEPAVASNPMIESPPTHPKAELLSIFPDPALRFNKRQLGVLAGSGKVVDQATAPLASGKNEKFIDLNIPQSMKRSQQSDSV